MQSSREESWDEPMMWPMTPQEARPFRDNRAKLRIHIDTIARFLDLPKGLHATFIYAESDPPSICVIVEGPELELVDPGAEAPPLGGITQVVEHATDDETGKTFHRLAWDYGTRSANNAMRQVASADGMASEAETATAIQAARDLLAEHHLGLIVVPRTTKAAPVGNDPTFWAHRTEIELAILRESEHWDYDVPAATVKDAAAAAARHTWPIYVASAGAHALLQDYEDGNPPPHFDCPTCSFPSRETTNLVCHTCGWDYSKGEKPVGAAGVEQ